MLYRLLKNSTQGRKGSIVDVDLNTARLLAQNGVVDIQNPITGPAWAPAIPVEPGHIGIMQKVTQPEITKKRRGRPRKADASHTAD